MDVKVMIKYGAEAQLFKFEYDNYYLLEKYRLEKEYRHPTIDLNVRKRRTRSEAKILYLANKNGVPTPKFILSSDFSVVMEFIDGPTLTYLFCDNMLTAPILNKCGYTIRALHSANIIHNDLTTSNFLFANSNVIIIDFGLAQIGNISWENKAVDIYVMEKSMTALTGSEELFYHILTGYSPEYELLSKLDEVRKRGRKK